MSAFPTFARGIRACGRAARATAWWVVGADRRGRRRRLGALAILIGLLAATHLTCSLVAKAELRSADAAIRGWGLPIEITQVVPPVLPESENAAPLLERAFVAMSLPSSPYVPGVSSGGLLPDILLAQRWIESRYVRTSEKIAQMRPEEAESAVAYLRGTSCAEICGLLHEAVSRPHLRFDLDYTAGPGLRLPHLSLMRMASSLLDGRAEATGVGRTAAIADILALGSRMCEEPFIISQLVAVSVDAWALRALRKALADGALDADDAASLLDACTRPDDGAARFAHALDAERLIFAKVFTGDVPDLGMTSGSFYSSFLGYPLRLHDHACHDRLLGEASERLRRDGYTADLHLPDPGQLAVLSRMILPSFQQMNSLAARSRADLDLACLALALRRHHADLGAYPTSLDELAPRYLKRVPLQPGRGIPYAYAPTSDGGCAVSLPQDYLERGRTVEERTWHLPR